MSEKTVQEMTEKPPLYWEARRYCAEHGLGPEDLERVRTMLAVVEFRRRSEPYMKQAAKLLGAEPMKWVRSGDSMVRADISPETDRAMKAIQEMIDMEAERLGLTVPAR
jgi:hypothetical protein